MNKMQNKIKFEKAQLIMLFHKKHKSKLTDKSVIAYQQESTNSYKIEYQPFYKTISKMEIQ
jgi:hypothetical protein